MEYVGLLREYGFPIMVCAWFMWRLEKKIDRFTDHVNRLTSAVRLMAAALDVDSDENGD